MNASVPATSSGTAIHHDAGELQPERAHAEPTKIAICTSAISTVTTTRAPTTDAGRDRRQLEPPEQLAVAPALERRGRAERRADRDRPAEQPGRHELDGLQRLVLDPLGRSNV